MVNKKDLRSFIILNISPPIANQSSLIQRLKVQSGKPININEDRIYYKIKDIDDNLFEIELLWETIQEINSEVLTEDGQILTKQDAIKNVSSLVIWIYPGCPFIFVFGKGLLYKKIIKLLQTFFENYNVQEIILEDKFFRNLIESNYLSHVTQLTYESATNNQEFMISISGHGIENSILWPDTIQGHIIDMKLKINGNTLKINQRGRVSLFNSPYVEDVMRITEYLKNILISSYKGGNSLE